jgi:hypothetical protein
MNELKMRDKVALAVAVFTVVAAAGSGRGPLDILLAVVVNTGIVLGLGALFGGLRR